MTREIKYDVFLSHNSADKGAVEYLAQKLRENGLEPFLDKWHLIPGEPWQEGLEQALDQSRTCAVFLGPSGLGPWENEEMRSGLDERTRNPEFRVIPVLLPDTQMPERGRLPRFLSRLTWVDFRQGLDDEKVFHYLMCGIQGIPPGAPKDVKLPEEEICPYRGLEVFHEEHAEFFFGREAMTQWLVESLRDSHFLAVIGPSGSGKSSLVRSGLVPALRQGALPGSADWHIITITPGTQPLEELAVYLAPVLYREDDPLVRMLALQDTLRSDHRALHSTVRLTLEDCPATARVLIIVDQFEELFTLVTAEEERQSFLENLQYASSIAQGRTVVVITMRADFYTRAAVYPELADRLADHQILVTPMAESELHQAIEVPAQRVGLTFDPGLVDTILADIGKEPGSLPLLEHALLQLWRRRQGRQLTFDAYREIGGVSGAIAHQADAEYNALSPEQQVVARRILMRLVQPGEGTEDTRRRALFTEFLSDPEQVPAVKTVIRTLVDARLLTTDLDVVSKEELVDVAHEALIRGWPRLRGWLDEDRAALRTYRRLTQRAQEWKRLNRDEGSLLRGAQLAETEEWARTHKDEMSALERDFLDSSLTFRERQAVEREEQRQRELEAARKLAEEKTKAAIRLHRRAWLLGGIGSVAVVLAIIAFIMFDTAKREQRIARTAQAKAEEESQISLVRQLAAQSSAELEQRPRRGLLLAMEAISNMRGINRFIADAEESLREALAETGGIPIPLQWEDSFYPGVEFSPDGHWLALPDAEDGIDVWLWNIDDLAEEPIKLGGHKRKITTIKFNPARNFLVTGSEDRTVRLWDINDPTNPLIILERRAAWSPQVEFSEDGRWLAFEQADNTVILWDTTNLTKEPITLRGHLEDIFRMALSPDNQWLVAGAWEGNTLLWNITEPSMEPIVVNSVGVGDLAFSADSRWLGVGSRTRFALLWNLIDLTAKPIELPGHIEGVNSIRFSPDGRWVATAARSLVRLWDLKNLSATPVSLHAHSGRVFTLVFSRDGGQLATGGTDGTVRLWNVTDPTKPPVELRGHESTIYRIAYSPDETLLATGSGDGTARLWMLDKPMSEPVILRGHEPRDWIHGIEFSSDGRWLATRGGDDTLVLWEMSDPAKAPVELVNKESFVSTVAFSPNGHWLAIGRNSGVLQLQDLRISDLDAEEIVLRGHTSVIDSMAFSQNNQWLATASKDNTVKIWNIENPTGEPIILRGHEAPVYRVAFSPDGKLLATSGEDNKIRLWDVSDLVANQVTELNRVPGEIIQQPFSPDGRWLVIVSENQVVRLLDIEQLEAEPVELYRLPPSGNVFAYSPDGRWFAIAGIDGIARVWTVNDWTQKPLELSGHLEGIGSIAFSPDGRWLATGSGDETTRLWDLHRADPAAESVELRRHDFTVQGVAFSPDGRWLATGGGDGIVRLWRVHLDELIERACQIAGRNLTYEEWQRFLRYREYRKTCPSLPIHPSFIEAGRNLAQAGDLLGALEWFYRALELDPNLDLDPEEEAQRIAVQSIVKRGKNLAWDGNIEGAIKEFRKALELDPSLGLDPVAEAKRIAAQSMVEKGKALAQADDVEGAIAELRRALELDPSLGLDPVAEAKRIAAQSLLEKSKDTIRYDLHNAIVQLRRAQELDPGLSPNAAETLIDAGVWFVYQGKIENALTAYTEAQTLHPNIKISAGEWNTLCWFGSLGGYAVDVMDACEQAAALDPENAGIRDSRGLARALTGDYTGAIEDFKFFVENGKDREAEILDKRQYWIRELEADRNPFDLSTLEALRDE